MNHKRMWESLKKTIEEEIDILSEERKKASTGFLADELETQYNEADYIFGEMEAIEARELLLQMKKKNGVKK